MPSGIKDFFLKIKKKMTFKFIDSLLQNLSDLLDDKEEYNVIFEVGQEPNKKFFAAHSAVLRYRSSYFNKELKNAIPEENNFIRTINRPDISANVFETILK